MVRGGEGSVSGPLLEFLAADGAWYEGTTSFRGLALRVHFTGFSYEEDEKWTVKRFKSADELRKNIRIASQPLQDYQCKYLREGTALCVSYKPSDGSVRFYDAILEKVMRANHNGNGKQAEVCKCSFQVLWQHGPCSSSSSVVECGDICIITNGNIEDDEEVRSFMEAIKYNTIGIPLPKLRSAGRNPLKQNIELPLKDGIGLKKKKKISINLPLERIHDIGLFGNVVHTRLRHMDSFLEKPAMACVGCCGSSCNIKSQRSTSKLDVEDTKAVLTDILDILGEACSNSLRKMRGSGDEEVFGASDNLFSNRVVSANGSIKCDCVPIESRIRAMPFRLLISHLQKLKHVHLELEAINGMRNMVDEETKVNFNESCQKEAASHDVIFDKSEVHVGFGKCTGNHQNVKRNINCLEGILEAYISSRSSIIEKGIKQNTDEGSEPSNLLVICQALLELLKACSIYQCDMCVSAIRQVIEVLGCSHQGLQLDGAGAKDKNETVPSWTCESLIEDCSLDDCKEDVARNAMDTSGISKLRQEFEGHHVLDRSTNSNDDEQEAVVSGGSSPLFIERMCEGTMMESCSSDCNIIQQRVVGWLKHYGYVDASSLVWCDKAEVPSQLEAVPSWKVPWMLLIEMNGEEINLKAAFDALSHISPGLELLCILPTMNHGELTRVLACYQDGASAELTLSKLFEDKLCICSGGERPWEVSSAKDSLDPGYLQIELILTTQVERLEKTCTS